MNAHPNPITSAHPNPIMTTHPHSLKNPKIPLIGIKYTNFATIHLLRLPLLPIAIIQKRPSLALCLLGSLPEYSLFVSKKSLLIGGIVQKKRRMILWILLVKKLIGT